MSNVKINPSHLIYLACLSGGYVHTIYTPCSVDRLGMKLSIRLVWCLNVHHEDKVYPIVQTLLDNIHEEGRFLESEMKFLRLIMTMMYVLKSKFLLE